MFTRALIPAALLLLPALAPAQAPAGRDETVYTWRGTLPANGLLTIRNHNGPIDVRPSSGNTVELRAEKQPRGGADVRDVEFGVRTSSSGDVMICSIYRGQDPCDDERGWHDYDGWRRGSVTVAMTVLVPRSALVKVATGNGMVTVERTGSNVQAATGNGRVSVSGTEGTVRVSTGNGDVEVRDARAAVRVTTGNGAIRVNTAEGPVEARSGNGDIDVRISSLRAADNMQFSTGSGEVRVTLPSNYNGELDATTGNGELRSDFELKIQGRLSPRHVRATIGSGGPMLRLATGNGRMELRKQ